MITLCPHCESGTPFYDITLVCCRVRLLESLPNFKRQKVQIERWLKQADRLEGQAAIDEHARVQQTRDEMNRRHRSGKAA